jgi:hypothetical protein
MELCEPLPVRLPRSLRPPPLVCQLTRLGRLLSLSSACRTFLHDQQADDRKRTTSETTSVLVGREGCSWAVAG